VQVAMQQGSASVLQSKPLELVEQRSNGLHSQAVAAAKQGTTKAKQSGNTSRQEAAVACLQHGCAWRKATHGKLLSPR
jgi:hypothetical protein